MARSLLINPPLLLPLEKRLSADGNHHLDSVFLDLFYLGRLLKKGSLIVLDDFSWAGINKAISWPCELPPHLTNVPGDSWRSFSECEGVIC